MQRIRCAVLMVTALGLGLGCASSQSGAPASSNVHWREASRPVGISGWAQELPASFQQVVAVGCSPLAHPDRSLELAIDRAYENLARAQQVRVEARSAELFEGRFRFPVQHTSEALNEGAEDRARSGAVVLDTLVIEGPPGARTVRTYVLVGPPGISLPSENRTFRPFDVSGPPEWFNIPPEAPGYLFGVGACGFYPEVADAWGAVEKLARLDLAGEVFTQSHSGITDELKGKGARTYGYSEQNVRADLRSVVIMARHYDPEGRMFYALARMPVRR